MNFGNILSIEIEFSLSVGEWCEIEAQFLIVTHDLIQK